MSHYTEKVICAADCQREHAASVSIRSTSHEDSHDPRHSASTARMVPCAFHQSGGTEGVRCEQIIAWEVQRTTSSNGLVTRFPIPITAESKNADLDCTIWGIKRPDGKFFFAAGANEGISKEKLSKFALLMETESLGEKLAFQGRSNGDVGHRLQTPEVVLAPQ